jgi:hypothetical protein
MRTTNPNSGVDTVTGSFSSTGFSDVFEPTADFNISVWGTFVATVALKRSFDGGGTWLQKWPEEIYQLDSPRSFTDAEPEKAVMYRLECISFTSGTINYRMSQ